ncbi:MAG: OmpA family protein, partial [Proteobacteria bacterium]|nr:OmpA family protein [Pseudomonadota bacterium]
MKNALFGAAALALLPVASQAQSLQYPGFFAGVEAGGNYMFQSGITSPFGQANMYPNIGYSFGGMIGYDFVGPRVALEGLYNNSRATVSGGTAAYGATKDEIAAMANLYYDFNAGGTIVPYIGAGAGVAFIKESALGQQDNTTAFAYQGIIGVGYNIDSQFRVNLEGRYFGTSTPTSLGQGFQNNNLIAMLQLQMKFGAPETVAAAAPPPAAPQAPSFMVFFDWDRSNLSAQAMNTIRQAAGAYKTKGSARITATGHTDKSGPDDYNMALSLRRANAVKDALVREGVPATAISVTGR